MENDSYTIKRKLILVMVFISLVIILPILYYSMMSIPYADDLTNAGMGKKYLEQYGSYFLSGLANIRYSYINWQGSYTAAFLVAFLQPVLRGWVHALRICNTACNALLFCTFFFLAYEFVALVGYDRLIDRVEISLYLYVFFLFCITNNYMNNEIYTWFTVMAVYVIPSFVGGWDSPYT